MSTATIDDAVKGVLREFVVPEEVAYPIRKNFSALSGYLQENQDKVKNLQDIVAFTDNHFPNALLILSISTGYDGSPDKNPDLGISVHYNSGETLREFMRHSDTIARLHAGLDRIYIHYEVVEKLYHEFIDTTFLMFGISPHERFRKGGNGGPTDEAVAQFIAKYPCVIPALQNLEKNGGIWHHGQHRMRPENGKLIVPLYLNKERSSKGSFEKRFWKYNSQRAKPLLQFEYIK